MLIDVNTLVKKKQNKNKKKAIEHKTFYIKR